MFRQHIQRQLPVGSTDYTGAKLSQLQADQLPVDIVILNQQHPHTKSGLHIPHRLL